jgi:hypothetical protein
MAKLIVVGRVVASSLVLALAPMPGCSGSDDADPTEAAGAHDPSDEDRTVGVMVSAMTEHARADFRTEQDARCVARGVVDGLGIDRLEELGLDVGRRRGPELTVPPMTDAEGDLVYAAYDECLDFEARDVEHFTANGLTEEEARCAHERYRSSSVPQTHLLLQDHDEVPHPELHAQVEAEWNGAQAACRGVTG